MVADLATDVDELLGSDDFFANPYPVYSRLREEAPVHWSPQWGCWVVTRYDDVHAALRNHAHFSNVGRQTAFLSRLSLERQQHLEKLSSHYTGGGLSNQDPPEHTRLRASILKAFTPRVISSLVPRIQLIVNQLLDGLETDQPVDLIDRFAFPLPAIVIAELLGLPPEDRDQFKAWSDEVTAFLGTGIADDASALRGQEAMIQLREYLGGLLAARRRQPAGDLLSQFAAGGPECDALSDGEAIGSCVTLLLGGHETTTNLLANGLLALLQNPDQLELLRREPSMMDSAVEEMLRFDAPVQRIWRLVKQDVTCRGRHLRQADSVFLMVGSANRDRAQFFDPDRLDIGRRPNRHLTFGHGIHFCLGAALARLEAGIALTAIIVRFSRIELASPTEFKPNVAFRGLVSLPVVLSTAGRGGKPMRREPVR